MDEKIQRLLKPTVKQNLPLATYLLKLKLIAQRFFINGFQKPAPQLSVHLHRRALVPAKFIP